MQSCTVFPSGSASSMYGLRPLCLDANCCSNPATAVARDDGGASAQAHAKKATECEKRNAHFTLSGRVKSTLGSHQGVPSVGRTALQASWMAGQKATRCSVDNSP